MDPRLTVVLRETKETQTLSAQQRANIAKLSAKFGPDAVIAGIRKGVSDNCLSQLREADPDLTKMCRELRGAVFVTDIRSAFKTSDKRIRQLSASNIKNMQVDMRHALENQRREFVRSKFRNYYSGGVSQSEVISDAKEGALALAERVFSAAYENPMVAVFALLGGLKMIAGGFAGVSVSTVAVVGISSIAALYQVVAYAKPEYNLPNLQWSSFRMSMLDDEAEYRQWYERTSKNDATNAPTPAPMEAPVDNDEVVFGFHEQAQQELPRMARDDITPANDFARDVVYEGTRYRPPDPPTEPSSPQQGRGILPSIPLCRTTMGYRCLD